MLVTILIKIQIKILFICVINSKENLNWLFPSVKKMFNKKITISECYKKLSIKEVIHLFIILKRM